MGGQLSTTLFPNENKLAFSLQKDFGMSPTKELLEKSKTDNFFNFAISGGMLPTKRFSYNIIVLKFVMSPKNEGIVPETTMSNICNILNDKHVIMQLIVEICLFAC